MKDYQDKLGAFAKKLKTEPPPVPLQKVEPVKVITEPDVQFNIEIPKSLRKQLKTYSNEHDISLKDMTINALKNYIKDNQQQE